MKNISLPEIIALILFVFGISWVGVNREYAHCDIQGCPVAEDEKITVEEKDIAPVLEWVKKDNNSEALAFETPSR